MKLLSTIALPDRVSSLFRDWFQVIEGSLADVRSSDAAVLLCSIASGRIDRATIESFPATLKAIATYSVGIDHIDLPAAKDRDIAVFNTPGVLSDAVADLTMLLILGAARRLTESVLLVRSGAWRGWQPTQLLGTTLGGRMLGIFGMGEIGAKVAQRASSFGMKISYHNRRAVDGASATYYSDARALIADSDVILLAWPSTSATRYFFDAETLSLARKDAMVINIGRGDLIDDEALIAALRESKILAAGLDVFNNEPDIHPGYLDLPNVFLTPHIGSSTWEARIAMGQILVDAIKVWSSGGHPENRVA